MTYEQQASIRQQRHREVWLAELSKLNEDVADIIECCIFEVESGEDQDRTARLRSDVRTRSCREEVYQ